MWGAGMSSEKIVKDAYILAVQSLPYTVVTMDNYTFAYGGVYSFVPCYTKKGLLLGIKKLYFGDCNAQMEQYKMWKNCKKCGKIDTALCHRMPKSMGGTPCINNVDYDCAQCNHDASNQIVNGIVRNYLKNERITFTYTVTVL